jgi:hypothetical protein
MPDALEGSNQYISLARAADLSGQSAETLRAQAVRGRLRTIKIGRDHLTTRRWVHEYLVEARQRNKGRRRLPPVEMPVDGAHLSREMYMALGSAMAMVNGGHSSFPQSEWKTFLTALQTTLGPTWRVGAATLVHSASYHYRSLRVTHRPTLTRCVAKFCTPFDPDYQDYYMLYSVAINNPRSIGSPCHAS